MYLLLSINTKFTKRNTADHTRCLGHENLPRIVRLGVKDQFPRFTFFDQGTLLGGFLMLHKHYQRRLGSPSLRNATRGRENHLSSITDAGGMRDLSLGVTRQIVLDIDDEKSAAWGSHRDLTDHVVEVS